MISVSNRWKELNEQTLLPEMFVELTYHITEPGLQSDAVVSASSPTSYSNVAQIVDGSEKNSEVYCTLEYGAWGLDGKSKFFDGSPVDPGYVYKYYSVSSGTFATSPTITIDFSERRKVYVPGMVIVWDGAFGGCARDFEVIASNADGEVARKTVKNNTSTVTHVDIDLINYSKITIQISRWSHPYQHPKCTDILFGVKKVYTKDDLFSFSHEQNVDLLSASLPENTIKFGLRNDDDRWNPDSPMATERYLAERQEISLRYGMDVDGEIEWIKGGTFWLSEWNTPSNGMEADFTARNAVEFMGAIYKGVRKGTLYDIAVAAFEEANIPKTSKGSNRYFVDQSLRNLSTDFSNDTTQFRISEILQMVAHAGNCVFYQNRDGEIKIEPWSQTYEGYIITPDISYSHPEYTFNKSLKRVSVNYGSDSGSVDLDYSSTGEIQTVSNPLISTKDDATRVGQRALEILQNRKVISGDFRADLRMDALDCMIVTSKYASNIIGITNVSYKTSGGAFRGQYIGRVVSAKLNPVNVYSGEFYANEIW